MERVRQKNAGDARAIAASFMGGSKMQMRSQWLAAEKTPDHPGPRRVGGMAQWHRLPNSLIVELPAPAIEGR